MFDRKKAVRRIKRFIATGKPQHRVRKMEENKYEYVVEHHGETVIFKVDKLGRCRISNVK